MLEDQDSEETLWDRVDNPLIYSSEEAHNLHRTMEVQLEVYRKISMIFSVRRLNNQLTRSTISSEQAQTHNNPQPQQLLRTTSSLSSRLRTTTWGVATRSPKCSNNQLSRTWEDRTLNSNNNRLISSRTRSSRWQWEATRSRLNSRCPCSSSSKCSSSNSSSRWVCSNSNLNK